MECWNVGSKEAVRLKDPFFHYSIVPLRCVAGIAVCLNCKGVQSNG